MYLYSPEWFEEEIKHCNTMIKICRWGIVFVICFFTIIGGLLLWT